MSNHQPETAERTPREVAQAIYEDLLGRRGVGDELMTVDHEIQGEIIDHWTDLIESLLSRSTSGEQSAPAAPRERETPLTVKVEGGALVIAIGVETLAFAVLAGEVFQEGVTIPDPDKFAKEVARELEQEREDGATPVHLLLDRAAYRAAENGAEGIHFPDDDPHRALAPSTSGGK